MVLNALRPPQAPVSNTQLPGPLAAPLQEDLAPAAAGGPGTRRCRRTWHPPLQEDLAPAAAGGPGTRRCRRTWHPPLQEDLAPAAAGGPGTRRCRRTWHPRDTSC
uniref:Uncharacterized protein n=1 Tax=Knipowitschia caucasica TaxID=637954 RepID=A0AAV2MGK8_KNICA